MFSMNKCRITGFVVLFLIICFSHTAEQPTYDDLYEEERIPLPDKSKNYIIVKQMIDWLQ